MASENLEFGTVMESLMRSGRTGEHLTPDELIDYSEGNLPPDREDEALDHLAGCPECASAVLDLTSFPELRQTQPCPTLREMWDDWREVQRELGLEPAPAVSTAATSKTSSGTRLWVWQAVAATLLVPLLVLGFWTRDLQQRIGQLSEPHGAVLVEDLMSADRITRGTGDQNTTEVPPNVRVVMWTLVTRHLEDYPAYEVDITQAAAPEQLVWRGPVQRLPGEVSYTLTFSRDYLASGEYVLALYGVQEGVRTPIARYERAVRHVQ